VGNKGGWAVSASFVDIDRDGWLDLFVGNYLLYSLEGDIDCLSVTGQHDYCPPNSYRPQPSKLYRNRGDGTFIDITRTALEGGAYGPALGVSTADFNNDGWIDIYVGNDGMPNQLWINQKNGRFKDMAFLNGAAVNGQGNSEASMGIDAGDYDRLRVSKGRLFYLSQPAGASEAALRMYDVAARSDKSVIEKIGTYELSANGARLIYRAGTTVGILDTGATGKVGDGAFSLEQLTMRLDRRAEWKQIFDEAWRMLRDNFYDPTMRGVDWPAMKRRYEAELPYVALRSDLNFLIGEMNGE
jgi:hypothetical protein